MTCEAASHSLTMATTLERAGALFGERPAVIDREGTMTWAEHVERVARAAAVLQGLGVRPGERFAIISRNSFRQAELEHAGFWLGAVPVPINFRLAPPEIRFILDDADCRLLAVEDRFAALLDHELFARWRERALYVAPAAADVPWPQYERLLADARPLPVHRADPQDDAILLYTGGTTGRSKGVPLSHANILANALQTGLATRPTSDDRYLHMAPNFHSADLLATSVTLVGGAHAWLGEFSPRQLLETLATQRITFLMLPPTVIALTLQDPEFARYDLSRLRLIWYGSAPMAVEWIRRTMETLPHTELLQSYGLTETAPILTTLSPEEHRRALASGDYAVLRSVGKPLAHVDLRIFDDDDREVPAGEAGEVVVRAPNVTRGYWRMPELNAEAFRHGWFHTGDIGRLDERGNLYILDRKKDMIISGGENIYSSEVEAALYKHPGVAEAAVVGVPDPKWGETVLAAIVPAAGAKLTEAEIIEHCRQLIGGYKLPRRLVFLEALPKSAVGKILKTELRRRYGDAGQTQAS